MGKNLVYVWLSTVCGLRHPLGILERAYLHTRGSHWILSCLRRLSQLTVELHIHGAI